MKEKKAEALVESETAVDEAPINTDDYSRLSVDQLESLIGKYENYLSLRDSILNVEKADSKYTLNEELSSSKPIINTKVNVRKGKVHNYCDWVPRELTLLNLKDVVTEVGLSNKLFVLAQAVLETGNFSSRVCKEYNNLFGLYDSKNKEYFRFARWEDSVVGYERMIQCRYKGGNYLHFLKRIGYAEDPSYISKIAKTAKVLYRKLFAQ